MEGDPFDMHSIVFGAQELHTSEFVAGFKNQFPVVRIVNLVVGNKGRNQVSDHIVSPIVLCDANFQIALRMGDGKTLLPDRKVHLLMTRIRVNIRISSDLSADADQRFNN